MRQILFLTKVFLLVVTVGVLVGVLKAQPPQGEMPPARDQGDFRTNALRQLGLSREQFQQIRRLNMQRRPVMEEAQQRLRRANKALDEVIYADNVSEADFQTRLQAFQAAQAEVAKVRFMNELAVRRVLTPAQLAKFRQMRQRFEQARRVGDARGFNNSAPQNPRWTGAPSPSSVDDSSPRRPNDQWNR